MKTIFGAYFTYIFNLAPVLHCLQVYKMIHLCSSEYRSSSLEVEPTRRRNLTTPMWRNGFRVYRSSTEKVMKLGESLSSFTPDARSKHIHDAGELAYIYYDTYLLVIHHNKTKVEIYSLHLTLSLPIIPLHSKNLYQANEDVDHI